MSDEDQNLEAQIGIMFRYIVVIIGILVLLFIFSHLR